MNSHKTGTSMSFIIDTRKSKKHRIMTECDCSRCVNKVRSGRRFSCRFGWEPIAGKCNRFGVNQNTLSKEEKKLAKELTKTNKEKQLEEKKAQEKVYGITIEELNNHLDTNITLEKLRKLDRYRNMGNGRFRVKFIGCEGQDMIALKSKDNKVRKYKVLQKINNN